MRLPSRSDWDDASEISKYLAKFKTLPDFRSARAAIYQDEMLASGGRIDTDVKYGTHPSEKSDFTWPDNKPKVSGFCP